MPERLTPAVPVIDCELYELKCQLLAHVLICLTDLMNVDGIMKTSEYNCLSLEDVFFTFTYCMSLPYIITRIFNNYKVTVPSNSA